jgi:hypothetical protein
MKPHPTKTKSSSTRARCGATDGNRAQTLAAQFKRAIETAPTTPISAYPFVGTVQDSVLTFSATDLAWQSGLPPVCA